MTKALVLGVASALFFSSTFVLNRVMGIDGASLWWMSSLRYFFTVPLLIMIVWFQGGLKPVWDAVAVRPWPWILWGTVGFGLFYLPLTWVAAWAPAWLLASSWQLTIIAGSLLVPIIGGVSLGDRRIPVKALWPSGLILVGVLLTQWSVARLTGPRVWWALVPILIAACAYPLGNRLMMRYSREHGPFDVYQRTLGMTLGSLPLWIVVAAIGLVQAGPPTSRELWYTLAVAILSGIVATLLFFAATDMARGRTHWLARIEATQSMEIVFTALLSSALFGAQWPNLYGDAGMLIIVGGMILHSLGSSVRQENPELESNLLG